MSSPNFLFEVNDLVMKKKILSVREHYDFEDVNGAKLGEADGAIIQVPPKFVVVDNHGQKLMHLEGKMLSFRSQFTFYDNQSAELGTIRKKIVELVGEEYWVEKNGFEFMRIYGDFTEHDYQMEVNGAPVASIHKKWVSLRDQIGISINGSGGPSCSRWSGSCHRVHRGHGKAKIIHNSSNYKQKYETVKNYLIISPIANFSPTWTILTLTRSRGLAFGT